MSRRTLREPRWYEITQESFVLSRRKMTGLLAGAGAIAMTPISARAGLQPDDAPTPEELVTGYNNFYEFGMDKTDPAANAHQLTTTPWTVEIAGEAKKTGTFDIADVLKGIAVEERVYRFRCVEAWSMVVPWMGVSLAKVLSKFEPNGNAKYVEFTTLRRPSEMPGQRGFGSGIDWPYVEGLRIDEAMHPLAIMVTGLYGKPLPKQNGAPWRLMVPWKYGFKSGKSIVKIRFTERQPRTSWNVLAPQEYGFYANVNPAVDHPRWSQAKERRLPSTLFSPNWRETLPFNGYADDVASLYANMDLRRHY